MEELPLEETARLLPVEDPEATPAADVWLPMGVLEHPPKPPLNIRCTHIRLETISDGEVRVLLVLLYLQWVPIAASQKVMENNHGYLRHVSVSRAGRLSIDSHTRRSARPYPAQLCVVRASAPHRLDVCCGHRHALDEGNQPAPALEGAVAAATLRGAALLLWTALDSGARARRTAPAVGLVWPALYRPRE